MGLNRLSVKLMIGYTTSSVEQRNRVIARNQDSQFGVVTKSDALVPFFLFHLLVEVLLLKFNLSRSILESRSRPSQCNKLFYLLLIETIDYVS